MKRYFNIALLLMALGLNVFIRLSPDFLPLTKRLARYDVMNNLTEDARKHVEQNFKDLPAELGLKAAEDLVNIWKKEKKDYINEEVRNKEKEIKSYWQDESGHTFLLELDPYHWFRLVKNLTLRGRIGDKTIGKDEYDSFMLAPIGMKVKLSLHKNLHVYLSYYFFKAARLFDNNISLMHFVFYMPIFISSLALLAVFFFCLSISVNKVNISGFFSALVLGLAPIFLSRSQGGWFDTDPYIVLFSILSVWTFYLGLRGEAVFMKRLLFTAISGLCIGLFSFAWDGWWYIFDLIIFSALFYLLNLYLINKGAQAKEEINLKAPLLSLSLFVLTAAVFVYTFSGGEVFWHFLSGPLKGIFAKSYLRGQFWPNTFITVGELKKADIIEVFNSIGGIFILVLGNVYLIITLFDRGYGKDRQFISFLFVFWIAIITYVAMFSVRFALLFAVPLSVSFGMFVETAGGFLNKAISRLVKGGRIKVTAQFVFCAGLAFFLFNRALPFRESAPVLINRSWWSILNSIKERTPGDAILNSWWDYGHWFKAIAERRVIFDGATQNTPLAYWMGRFFLTDSQIEAQGILRMLNSGSNQAFEELERLGFHNYRALEILKEIILLKKKGADAKLTQYLLSKGDRDRILRLTHNPQNAYLIIEPSLILKIKAISLLGGWDFKKAAIYRRFRELKKKEFIEYLTREQKYSEADALRTSDMLSFLNTDDAPGWISSSNRYYGESTAFRKEGGLLLFNNDFVVDLTSHYAYLNDKLRNKWSLPKGIFYFEGDALKEIKFKAGDLDFSVLLIQEKDNYKLVCLDEGLVNSMLTRLYYLNGRGMNNFQPFITQDLKDNRGRIIVYKVEWDKDE